MSFGDWLRPRLLDLMMRQMNGLRPEVLAPASGDVLEVGFGTGLNVDFYPTAISSLTAVDPNIAEGFEATEARIAEAPFSVERCALRADRSLPFDSGRFDTVVTTWTLCSIPDPGRALEEMRRVLKPGGQYVFIEHGRAPSEKTALWQDRVNPIWRRLADGCNMNRSIDRLVEDAGFRMTRLERFRHDGPSLLAHMYRGVAAREL